jgi:hypothetical protein
MKNIMKIKGKKGIATLFIVLGIVLVLLVIYIFLFIPIPAFTKLRMFINYFLIVLFWIMLQVGLIYGYYKLGRLAGKGFILIKTKMVKWSLNIRHYIITHS